MPGSIRKFTEMPLQNAPALGVRVICDIPTTSDLENLLLLVSGTVTLTTAAAALTNIDGILNLITAVELIGDGRDTIISIPMTQASRGNLFRHKTRVAPAPVQPGVAIATHPFSMEAVLDLASWGSIRNKDSSLRENQYKTLQLAIRYAGDFAGVLSGGVVSASTHSLTVAARETIEMDGEMEEASAPIMRVLQSARDDNFGGSVSRQRFRLTPEQGLRGLCLRVTTTANALSDAVLSRVRLYVGKDLRFDFSAATIKRMTEQNSVSGSPVGYYFLDFADGEGSPDKLNDTIDMRFSATQNAWWTTWLTISKAGVVNVAQYGYVTL